jgi:flagellar biosynthesis protein FliR
VDIYPTQLVLYSLIFIRVMSLVVTAPVLGHDSIPLEVKLAIGLFVSLVIYPMLAASHPVVDMRLGWYFLTAIREAGVGLVLGFAMSLIMYGATVAGEMMSFDMGLGMAVAMDPQTGEQNPVITEMIRLLLVLVFLLVNGHHFVLQTLRMSFDTVGIGGFAVTQTGTDKLITLAGLVLIYGIKLASPIIVASFLVNVALGILTRVAPQINVFMLNFQIKIAVGFVILMTSLPMMVYVFKKLLAGFEDNIVDLVRVL